MRTSKDDGENLRIALFLPDLGIGGAERVFVTLANQIAKKDIRVDLVLARKTGELLHEVDPAVDIIDLGAGQSNKSILRFGILTVYKLARYLSNTAPDVLLSTLTGANLTAILARVFSRSTAKLVIREAATLSNVKSRPRLLLMKLLYPLSDRVIVLTDFMQKEMEASLRIPEGKITIIDNPVDSEAIQSLAADHDAIQTIEEMRPYAVGIGRLVEQKDYSTAIHAIAHVNTMQQLNYVILGEGPQKGELQALTKTLGIEKQVHFLGNRTNPYPWLKHAKIFVLPSRWEGYPNVLLEAMSLGCAIAVTKYDPSVGKILSNYPEQLHRMVNVGDSRKLAAAIVELINDDDPPEHSGVNTVRRITNQYLAALEVPCARQRK